MNKILTILMMLIIGFAIISNLRFLFNQSIRLDESQSIWVATKSVSALLKINGQDVQVPLYTLMLHFWIQIFGTDIVFARMLSLIFFVGTLPLLYYLIKRSSEHNTAILGASLFALSPFLIWYSQEARTYTLLTFITTAFHLVFLRFMESKGRSMKLTYLIIACLGIYTHYFFFFVLGSQAIYVIYQLYKAKPEEKKIWRRFLYKYTGINLVLILTFLPWIWYVYRLGLASNTQPLIPRPSSISLLLLFVNFIVGFHTATVQSLLLALWPLLLLAIFLIFSRKIKKPLKRTDYFFMMSLMPVFLVYLVSFVKPIFLPRYLIIVVPTLFTLMAWLLSNLGNKLLSGTTTAVLAVMMLSLNFQNIAINTPVKEDYRTVVEEITQKATPFDIVAVTAPFTIYPLEYYYNGLARLDTIPHWNRYVQGPIPPFTTDELQKQVNEYAKIYNRMFVILSYDQGYQQDIINFLDQHYELLGNKRYQASIQMRVYKLRYD